MEENKKVFNLVYDDWEENQEQPRANCESVYGYQKIWDADNLIKHYVDDTLNPDSFIYKKNRIREVYEKPNENFYYFINHRNFFIEQLLGDLKPDYIKNPLSESVVKCLTECKNFKIVFMTEHEPDNINGFRMLMNYIKENDYDETQFYVINNNSNLNEFKEKFNSKINVHSLHFIPHSSTKVLYKVGGCPFKPNKEGKFSMYFNKSPRQQRWGLLVLLKHYGILDEMNWSFVPTWNFKADRTFFGELFTESQRNLYAKEMDYFSNLDIRVSDYEVDRKWFKKFEEPDTSMLPVWMTIPEQAENFENSYLNIITESIYFNRFGTIHITEKSFRPFYYYQFPIIMTSTHHIKKMKEKYDFDFFDDLINHSYDNEFDDVKRFYMIFKEIKRLHDNKEQVIEFYKNNQKRFENNKLKAINVLKTVEIDHEYFKNLI